MERPTKYQVPKGAAGASGADGRRGQAGQLRLSVGGVMRWPGGRPDPGQTQSARPALFGECLSTPLEGSTELLELGRVSASRLG